jgi:Tol biopolymer transport system component
VAEEGPPGPEGDQSRLYHRQLAEPAARALPGTEGAVAPSSSPDGKWVSFASPADRTRKKIALAGGGPTVLAEDVPFLQASGPGRWTAGDRIVFGDINGPLWQVPAAGGAAEAAVPRSALEGDEFGMTSPVPVRGGFLFAANAAPRGYRVVAWVDGQRRVLAKLGGMPQRAGTGHLLFTRPASATQTDLVAVALDPERVELQGEPVPVLSFEGPITYSISSAGALVYRAPRTESRGVRFAWLVRSDRSAPPAPPAPRAASSAVVRAPRLSPDGRRLLYGLSAGQENRAVVVDLASGSTRIVVSGPGFWSAWSHDGRRVIHQEPSGKDGAFGLAWRPVDGSGPAERLTESRGWQQPQAVTRDGRFLVYQETGGLGAKGPLDQTYDLWLLPLSPRGEPRPLLRTKASEKLPHLSVDGRWMAYVSDEAGQDEVWVRAFPDGQSAIRVSEGGGTEPLWAPDGRTLYYRDALGTRLFAVPVTAGEPPQFGTASATSGYWAGGSPYGRMYDAAPDGALLMLAGDTYGRELGVVLHFDEVIRRKLAEAK